MTTLKITTVQKGIFAVVTLAFAGVVSAASASKEGIDTIANSADIDAATLAAYPQLAKMPKTKISSGGDDLPHPLGEQRRALRKEALQQRLSDKTSGKGSGKIHEFPNGQYVELEREGEDLIWTVVAEFGDQDSWLFPGELLGPQKNEIPKPDVNNNTTIWREDFSRDHFMNMLFNDGKGANSMRNFYKEQSSGRYAVDGDVTDWVQVPYNTAHYGYYSSTTWWFIADALTAWYAEQIAAGRSAAEIDAYLSQFDVWDRYDYDGDGNFDEADGYIDHFQAVHAGEGNEAGGGAYGDFAIWSHRWYAEYPDIGATGPTLGDGSTNLGGGIQIGGSNFWIGDYTVEPENGGVGVFAHEFAHDHGLPDLYNTGGGPSNSTGHWTLMSAGSWTSDGTVDIGSKPTHMGAWEKFQLGWLDYDVAFSGFASDHNLGPAEYNSRNAQGLFVIAPDKEVTEDIAMPYSGSYFYYSGSGNNLDNAMFRSVTLPAGAVTLTAMVNYEIETDWDYAYLTVNGVSVETDHSTNTDPHGQNFGFGITDFSGGWVPLTADLSAFAGQTVDIGFRYWTDVAAVEAGFMVDDVQITGQPLDDAESDFGWTFDGFRSTTGSETSYYFNAFVAEYRQYRGYDEALQTGPYVFGYGGIPELQDTVDHFPYQDGLLISYWDGSQSNNNTASHPGEGLILPIDAHPEPLLLGPNTAFPGAVWWGSVQTFDATFSKQNTDSIVLNYRGVPTSYSGRPAVSEFDANKEYWLQGLPHHGVNPPKSDTIIRIKSGGPKSSFMQVEVR